MYYIEIGEVNSQTSPNRHSCMKLKKRMPYGDRPDPYLIPVKVQPHPYLSVSLECWGSHETDHGVIYNPTISIVWYSGKYMPDPSEAVIITD